MNLMQFDRWTQFTVNTVMAAAVRARRLGDNGRKVVAAREEGYRDWDPDTILIDKELEDMYIKKVTEHRVECTLITEEAGVLEIPGKPGRETDPADKVYVISDPFDGSSLYRRDIQAFWYTTLAVFSSTGEVITNAVGDCLSKVLYFCDSRGAWSGDINMRKLDKMKRISPSSTTDLKEAYLETYLMKSYFLNPAVERLGKLMNEVKFIVPNGGPGSLCDVACGKTDILIGIKEPLIDFYTGFGIAEKAGCLISDLKGNEIQFNADINNQYDYICSANREIHDKALAVLNA